VAHRTQPLKEATTMPQHYPKHTTEAIHFCRRCYCETRWRVLGGKLAFCIPCYDRPRPARIVKEDPEPEPTLF